MEKREPVFIGTKEAARRLNVGQHTMQKLCRTKPYGFPVVRLESKYLINAEQLDAWAARVAQEGGTLW